MEENSNAEVYLNLLQNQMLPSIRNIVGNVFHRVCIQHDGAPAHYIKFRNFLKKTFLNQWIGRLGGFIDWPARSPDHSLLDFFLAFLTNRVFETKPDNR